MPLVDCQSIVTEICNETKTILDGSSAILDIIFRYDDEPSKSFWKRLDEQGKDLNIEIRPHRMPGKVGEAHARVETFNRSDGDGIMLLSEPATYSEVRNSIYPDKNIEGDDCNDDVTKVFCTARACLKIIESQMDITGKIVTIIGYGKRVGKPLSYILMRAHAGSVTTCHKYTRDLVAHTGRADVIVTAVGKPGLITPQMLRHNTLVIDTGIIKHPETGKIVGDVREDVAKSCLVTPVPGGVGPVTVAILLQNVAIAHMRKEENATVSA